MHHALIEPDPSQSYVGSSFGWALPREWARFGLLYLNDGVWQGERLLPKGWAKYSASLAEHSHGQYGAQFWLNREDPEGEWSQRLPEVPDDTYIASGYQGQRVFIIPSENLVIVRLGLDPLEDFDFNLWVRDVVACLKD
jgi:CubicO group peptidase (beta-lactamase class C family)